MGNMFTASTSRYHFEDSIATLNKKKCRPLSANDKRMNVKDVKTFDANFTFLSSKLAKLHQKVYEPKAYFTYQDDMPIEQGGGFIDFIEYFSVNWAGIVNDTRNLFGNGGNLIPRVNGSMEQHIAKVYTYEVAYDIRFIELEKAKKAQLSKSIEQIYQDAIRVGWDYFCQSVAYLGINGDTGLFNSANVVVTTIDNHLTTGKGFEGYDDDVVVAFVNGIFQDVLTESNMNINLLPDTFLVPTFFSADMIGRFSALYSASLFEFIRDHNFGKMQGGDKFKFNIYARPLLDNAGVAGKGRIVVYKKDKDYVRMDMPAPIQHYTTLPNIERAGYTSLFVGQVSQVQMPYNTSATETGIVKYYDFSD